MYLTVCARGDAKAVDDLLPGMYDDQTESPDANKLKADTLSLF